MMMKSLPRITVVTPSFNQAAFLEETINSVFAQNYPNLEYFVIDGGSTDGSVDIIKRYESRISYWISEPDEGQAAAICHGFSRATGDLLYWLNSDDVLLPDALHRVAVLHAENPDSLILGGVEFLQQETGKVWARSQFGVSSEHLLRFWEGSNFCWLAPGMFIPRRVYEDTGSFDPHLRYCFDYEWALRALARNGVVYTHATVAQFRLHQASKTVSQSAKWTDEMCASILKHGPPGVLEPAQVHAEMLLCCTLIPGLIGTATRIPSTIGFRYLFKALCLYPRIVGSRRFWLVGVLLIVPRFFSIYVHEAAEFLGRRLSLIMKYARAGSASNPREK